MSAHVLLNLLNKLEGGGGNKFSSGHMLGDLDSIFII